LAERESEHKQAEQQAEGEGEADSLLSREPDVGLSIQDSILGLQDHVLSRRQSLNQLSHPGSPIHPFFKALSCFFLPWILYTANDFQTMKMDCFPDCGREG